MSACQPTVVISFSQTQLTNYVADWPPTSLFCWHHPTGSALVK